MSLHHPSHAAPASSATGRAHAATTPGLRYHSLVQPPLVRSATDQPTGRMTGVWTDDDEAASGAVTTRRRLALQTLQMRAARLGGPDALLTNTALRLLAEDQLNHLYLGNADFVLLAAAATDAFGEPARLPAFLTADEALLVIDASRFFEPGHARLTAVAYDAFAAMASSRELAARSLGALRRLVFADELEPTHAALIAGLHSVLCQALGKPRSEADAARNREFVARVGLDRSMRALLGAAQADVDAVCEAFLGLRKV